MIEEGVVQVGALERPGRCQWRPLRKTDKNNKAPGSQVVYLVSMPELQRVRGISRTRNVRTVCTLTLNKSVPYILVYSVIRNDKVALSYSININISSILL